MKRYGNLYHRVCSFENLYYAYQKVKKNKANQDKILEFEYNLEENLFKIKEKLENLSYEPQKPKRILNKSFSHQKIHCFTLPDQIVQQAILQLIEPLFDNSFIYDSYGSRKQKGMHRAIDRFDNFKRKVANKKNPYSGWILKMDIKKFYPSINHQILLNLINDKIKDKKIIWLIKRILESYNERGLPLGARTSALFANIYLNELDYFIKHNLFEKYYLRYMDDFVILPKNKEYLVSLLEKARVFLKNNLKLELHPQKTRIVNTNQGVDFLGFKHFYFYKLLRKRNVKRFKHKLDDFKKLYQVEKIEINKITQSIQGWIGYARYGDSYKLRKKIFREFRLH